MACSKLEARGHLLHKIGTPPKQISRECSSKKNCQREGVGVKNIAYPALVLNWWFHTKNTYIQPRIFNWGQISMMCNVWFYAFQAWNCYTIVPLCTETYRFSVDKNKCKYARSKNTLLFENQKLSKKLSYSFWTENSSQVWH